ncbi:hypothetical protein ABPG72_017749 [Tetrahymena utriculariae]
MNTSKRSLINQINEKVLKQFMEDKVQIVERLEDLGYKLDGKIINGGGFSILIPISSNQNQNMVIKLFQIQKNQNEAVNKEKEIYNLLKQGEKKKHFIELIDHIKVLDNWDGFIYKKYISLQQKCKDFQNGTEFTEQNMLTFVFDLIHGLIDLRRKSIIHLDIKMLNILINNEGNLVYCDFGIAEIKKQNQLIQCRGSVENFSPIEQNNCDLNYLIDFETDVYSLGKTLQPLIELFIQKNPQSLLRSFEEGLLNIIKEQMVLEDIKERSSCYEVHQQAYLLFKKIPKEYISQHQQYIEGLKKEIKSYIDLHADYQFEELNYLYKRFSRLKFKKKNKFNVNQLKFYENFQIEISKIFQDQKEYFIKNELSMLQESSHQVLIDFYESELKLKSKEDEENVKQIQTSFKKTVKMISQHLSSLQVGEIITNLDEIKKRILIYDETSIKELGQPLIDNEIKSIAKYLKELMKRYTCDISDQLKDSSIKELKQLQNLVKEYQSNQKDENVCQNQNQSFHQKNASNLAQNGLNEILQFLKLIKKCIIQSRLSKQEIEANSLESNADHINKLSESICHAKKINILQFQSIYEKQLSFQEVLEKYQNLVNSLNQFSQLQKIFDEIQNYQFREFQNLTIDEQLVFYVKGKWEQDIFERINDQIQSKIFQSYKSEIFKQLRQRQYYLCKIIISNQNEDWIIGFLKDEYQIFGDLEDQIFKIIYNPDQQDIDSQVQIFKTLGFDFQFIKLEQGNTSIIIFKKNDFLSISTKLEQLIQFKQNIQQIENNFEINSQNFLECTQCGDLEICENMNCFKNVKSLILAFLQNKKYSYYEYQSQLINGIIFQYSQIEELIPQYLHFIYKIIFSFLKNDQIDQYNTCSQQVVQNCEKSVLKKKQNSSLGENNKQIDIADLVNEYSFNDYQIQKIQDQNQEKLTPHCQRKWKLNKFNALNKNKVSDTFQILQKEIIIYLKTKNYFICNCFATNQSEDIFIGYQEQIKEKYIDYIFVIKYNPNNSEIQQYLQIKQFHEEINHFSINRNVHILILSKDVFLQIYNNFDQIKIEQNKDYFEQINKDKIIIQKNCKNCKKTKVINYQVLLMEEDPVYLYLQKINKMRMQQQKKEIKKSTLFQLLDHITVLENWDAFIYKYYETSFKHEYMDYKKGDKTFTEQNMLNFVFDLIHGLIDLREQSIIHLDIKLENILIDEQRTLVYCDFGISEIKKLYKVITCKGSPEGYSPKELIRADLNYQIDFESDIYSLGKTLWYIINLFIQLNPQSQSITFAEGLLKIISDQMILEDIKQRSNCYQESFLNLKQNFIKKELSKFQRFSNQTLIDYYNSVQKIENKEKKKKVDQKQLSLEVAVCKIQKYLSPLRLDEIIKNLDDIKSIEQKKLIQNVNIQQVFIYQKIEL